MSSRYGLVDGDGLVVNVIEWDGEAAWSPPEGLSAVEVSTQVSVGWRCADGVWTVPEEA